MAAFLGMHVSPAKHSYAWLPRKCDYRTDTQTDAGQSDPFVPICFAGDETKKRWRWWIWFNDPTVQSRTLPLLPSPTGLHQARGDSGAYTCNQYSPPSLKGAQKWLTARPIIMAAIWLWWSSSDWFQRPLTLVSYPYCSWLQLYVQ